jgi:hypothetical protein
MAGTKSIGFRHVFAAFCPENTQKTGVFGLSGMFLSQGGKSIVIV